MRIALLPALALLLVAGRVAPAQRAPAQRAPAQRAPAQRPPTLQHLVTIGCADCATTARFSEVAGVAVSPNGTIWVADHEAPFVRAFRADGTPLRAFARRGQGPGELVAPGRIFLRRDGLTVLDARGNRLERFDTLGRVLGRVTFGRFAMEADMVGATGDLMLLFTRFTPGTGTIERWPVGATVGRPVTAPLATFPRADAPEEIYSMAVAPDGRVAVAQGGAEYRIRVIAPDGGSRDVVRQVARVPFTAEELEQVAAARAHGPMLAKMEGKSAGSNARATGDLPTLKPHLRWSALRFDDGGRLWANTARGNERESVLDVFDRALTFLGEVRVPHRVSTFAFAGRYAVTAGQDADGMPVVTLWRVR